MEQRNQGFDQAWAVWKRRKWLALPVFLVPFALAVSMVMFLPKIYQSTATLLVERQQVPQYIVKPTVTSSLETRLQTISQEILSRSRLESLITRFGLYRDLRRKASMEGVIDRMRRDITLESGGIRQSPVGRGRNATVAFTISYRGGDPQTVALVTNTLASFFIEENLKVREQQATGTTQFLKSQLDDIKKQLDGQEQRMSEFKKRYIGELPQQMQANLAILDRLNARLDLNSTNQTRFLERREALSRQLAEAESGASPGAPEDDSTRLTQLEQSLTELRTRFSDKYPDVVAAKAEIKAIERRLAESKKDGSAGKKPAPPETPYVLGIQKELGGVVTEISILKKEEKRLRKDIAAYQARVENTPRREQEYEDLSRNHETTKETYLSLLKKFEDAQLAESLEQRQKGEQFRILDPALPSQEPAAPKRLQLILLALLASAGLAVVAVVLAERLDTSFHTVDELRGFTRVPVLASIPRILTRSDARRRGRRFRIRAVSAVLALVLLVAVSYWLARGNEQLVWLLARGRF